MDKERLSTFFSISLGIITPFVASPLIYLWYFDESDLSMVILFPLLAILVSATAFLTVINLLNGWKWPFFGNLLFPALTLIFSVAMIGNKAILDSPKVKLHAGYHGKEGFDLWLREDMTIKVREATMISSDDEYGRYEVVGDTLFLSGINIEYGFSEVNDTLYFVNDGLAFRLDKEWRGVLEGEMYIRINRLK